MRAGRDSCSGGLFRSADAEPAAPGRTRDDGAPVGEYSPPMRSVSQAEPLRFKPTARRGVMWSSVVSSAGQARSTTRCARERTFGASETRESRRARIWSGSGEPASAEIGHGVLGTFPYDDAVAGRNHPGVEHLEQCADPATGVEPHVEPFDAHPQREVLARGPWHPHLEHHVTDLPTLADHGTRHVEPAHAEVLTEHARRNGDPELCAHQSASSLA